MANFQTDLKLGQEFEKHVGTKLIEFNPRYNIQYNESKSIEKLRDYDIALFNFATTITVECKFDKAGMRYGNAFFEFAYNDKTSGIYRSTANIIAYSNDGESFYLFDREHLINYIAENEQRWKVKYTKAGDTVGYVMKLDILFEEMEYKFWKPGMNKLELHTN